MLFKLHMKFGIQNILRPIFPAFGEADAPTSITSIILNLAKSMVNSRLVQDLRLIQIWNGRGMVITIANYIVWR